MTSRPRLLGVALLASGLLAGACGSSSTDATTDAPDAPTTTSAQPASTGDLAAAVKDFTFEPADLTVAVGTTITWTNQDRFGHTVTAGGPGTETGQFDIVLGLTTDKDTTGLAGSHTFSEAGTFDFFCRYHPSMVGTVTVTG